MFGRPSLSVRPSLGVLVMTSKKSAKLDCELAAVVRRSRAVNAAVCSDDMAGKILAALELGNALPTRKKGTKEFEEVDAATVWKGVQRLDTLRVDRVSARPGGDAILKALQNCSEADEDEAHWAGEDAELLDAVVRDDLEEPRINVMRAVDPFNPVALLTPLSEEPLAAVAAEDIEVGEPIAPYLGDLTLSDDPILQGDSNTYLYELDMAMLKLRGYKGVAKQHLRVDASRAGGEARFINDKWAPAGLPARSANCYIELIFDGETKDFFLVFFASKRIPKGKEIIADYGPDYWRVARSVLLRAHREEIQKHEAKSVGVATEASSISGKATAKRCAASASSRAKRTKR